MKTTVNVLLPLTQRGTPSGNYDGTVVPFAGVAQKAQAYYNGKSAATVALFLNGFVGVVEIQGTLESDPQTTNWVTLATVGDNVTPLTSNTAQDVVGNLVWVRAEVKRFTSGAINKATVSY